LLAACVIITSSSLVSPSPTAVTVNVCSTFQAVAPLVLKVTLAGLTVTAPMSPESGVTVTFPAGAAVSPTL